LARAELLRLRTAWATAADEAGRAAASERATALLNGKPDLIGPLHPLLEHGFRVLDHPTALALFLLADHAPTGRDPLAADTVWQGELRQRPSTEQARALASSNSRRNLSATAWRRAVVMSRLVGTGSMGGHSSLVSPTMAKP
jgi:hypothetical protein